MKKLLMAVAAIAAVWGARSVVAAPSGSYMCYKPDAGLASYPWSTAKWWFNSTENVPALNRLPTTSDAVFLYSSKNDRLTGKSPMTVGNGVAAETGALTICDAKNGQNFQIGVRIEDGGSMKNAGAVVVGNGGGSGYLEVLSGGAWTSLDNFYLGNSSKVSVLAVEQGGCFTNTATGDGLIVGDKGRGVVTNRGAMATYNLFIGGEIGTGTFDCYGELDITNKLTIGRKERAHGELYIHKGATFRKTPKDQTQQPIHVGYLGYGKLTVEGDIRFPDGEVLCLGPGIKDSTASAFGELIVNDAKLTNLGRLYVGWRGANLSAGRGRAELNGGSLLEVKNANIGFSHPSSLTLNDTSALTGVEDLSLCANDAASSSQLRLRGGSVLLQSHVQLDSYHLNLGTSPAEGGRIEVRGWGAFAPTSDCEFPQNLRITPNGHIVADGEGVERDLDFRCFRGTGRANTDYNAGGHSNGWYAVGRGRLLFPAVQPAGTDKTAFCVGDHPWNETLSLVNAFRATFTKPAKQMYAHAELYATDRTDIPSGLPVDEKGTVVKSVYRMGFTDSPDNMDNPVALRNVRLQFRYDATGVGAEQKVRLWHHDGTASGSWRRVGFAGNDPAATTVSTASAFDSISSTYNLGWFAVVAEKKKGLFIILK